jgi:hypothetical protein
VVVRGRASVRAGPGGGARDTTLARVPGATTGGEDGLGLGQGAASHRGLVTMRFLFVADMLILALGDRDPPLDTGGGSARVVELALGGGEGPGG